ncbi:MAG: OsmC family protein [Sandaracinaceae bacterium]|jgi:putative redox protein|nr:OsmC family protein [Sandaracinaceae bacterium]
MSQPIQISFPGGKRVEARLGEYTVLTDLPASAGGEGAGPGAFDLFLASIASCAGTYALGFCHARGIATDGLSLTQTYEVNPESHLPTSISIALHLPTSFPEKYRDAILRAVEGCKVKKTIAAAPTFNVQLSMEGADNVSPSHVQ